MASPPSIVITASSGKSLSLTPGSRVLQSPLSDEAIWKRLIDAGFDEESIKRRDKASLIGYIAKLEAEIFDHQHQMGLLLLERKELNSKYEQVKGYAEVGEIMYKRDQGAHSSTLAEARKQEESLKKALAVEKECVASLEKALHEMRAESAEMKVAAECKLAEAGIMVEDAQKKFTESEAKLHAAQSLQAEATRYHGVADRMLKEVESREDDLRRHMISFKSDYEVKEKEIDLERQSLCERQKILQLEQKRLLDGQALLNEREEYIFCKSQDLKRFEEELEASKASIQKELRALNDEKSTVKLNLASVSKREEAVVEREALLQKKEKELLVLQEKLASKESEEVKKLITDNKTAMKTRKSVYESELEIKRKLVEDEIETKRRACELRELDIGQREYLLLEREHDLEIRARELTEKDKDVVERLNLITERENRLIATEREIELKQAILQKEKEEIGKLKSELQSSLGSLEDKMKLVDYAKEELEITKSETNELSVLEMKLKEEIDMVRASKLELVAEADKLNVEKAKFEAEWELIDEKREELRKEAERVADERQAVLNFISDERISLRQEKDAMREQHQRDVDLLHREKEDFRNKMVQEHSEWFSKMQKEREDFLLDIEMQRRELENCIQKRRDELESYIRGKEEAFEQEKKSELQDIISLKETVAKELEHVASEMKKLENERMEINLDRVRREREWGDLNNSIEELKVQGEKLKKQRELLHADRKEISDQIERLKKYEDLKFSAECMDVAEVQLPSNISAKRVLTQPSIVKDADLYSDKKTDLTDYGSMQKPYASPSSSARLSWIRRCTDLIFKHSTEDQQKKFEERSLISDYEDASLSFGGQLDSSSGDAQKYDRNEKANEIFSMGLLTSYSLGEPKVILEVPPANGNVRTTHDLFSNVQEDACEKSAPSISDQGFLAGRKRRFETTNSNDGFATLIDQNQNKKKRREQKDTSVISSEHGFDHCVLSTHSDALDLQAYISFDEAQGAEETSVLVDKIIQISESACENTEIDNLHTGDTIDRLQNPVAEPDQDVLPCGSKAREMVHEEVLAE